VPAAISWSGLANRWHDDYRKLTGQDSPVRGGGPAIDAENDALAKHIISEELVHSRPRILSFYLGSAKKPKLPPSSEGE
jgi:hypothetical protein